MTEQVQFVQKMSKVSDLEPKASTLPINKAVDLNSTFKIVPTSDEGSPECQAAYNYFRDHFENFVFQGGGIRGIAFGGAICYLEKWNLVKQLKRIAGSSAGAIIAGALAVGYSGSEIIDLLHKTDFKTFEDDSKFGPFGDLWRFVNKYGIYKGDAFEKWYAKVLMEKTGDPNITFLQVYQRYGKELVITGTCLNTCETHYYHYLKYPNMPVKTAVRISMSIPALFASVQENGHVMVDGGVLNNYPIWVFDGNTIGDSRVTDDEILKSKTLGFKLMTDQEKADYKLYHIEEPVDNIIQYLKALINSMLIQIERGHIRTGYWPRTVCINTHNVGSLEFSLPSETKQKLIQGGYDSIHDKMVEIYKIISTGGGIDNEQYLIQHDDNLPTDYRGPEINQISTTNEQNHDDQLITICNQLKQLQLPNDIIEDLLNKMKL